MEFSTDYYPYGKVLREFVNTPERYLTTGHERDVETGLDYRGARYYNSDIGRFLSLDPLAKDFPSWSDYNYVLGNPIFFIDPDGKSPDGHYLDEDGNYLGEAGDKDDENVYVINKNDFDKKLDAEALNSKSTKLEEYNKGISVSAADWDKIEENGGSEIEPYLVNNSNSTVYFKPENGKTGLDNAGAYPLEKNQSLYISVDGVATKKYNNVVVKIPTGADITVTSEGGADIDYYGFGGLARMAGSYGWIYKSRIPSNDSSWDALFQKAKEIGKRKY